MSLSDFNDLCTSLCDLVGVDAPSLQRDEHGTLAFTITVDEVDTGIVFDDAAPEPGALLITSLGIPDESIERQLLRRLLDTNFIVSGVHSPSFNRNPATGEIALHQPCLLSHVTAQDIYDKLIRATKIKLQWDAGVFANSLDLAHSADHFPDSSAAAENRFAP